MLDQHRLLDCQHLKECLRGDNRNPLKLIQPEKITVTANDIGRIALNRTFQVAIVRWIVDDGEEQVSRRGDGDCGQTKQELLYHRL